MVDNFYNNIDFSILDKISKESLSNSSEYIKSFFEKEKKDINSLSESMKTDLAIIQSGSIERCQNFVVTEKQKMKETLEDEMDKRRNDLDQFRNSFLFDTPEKSKIFREKYKKPKYSFSDTWSRTDINNLNRDLSAMQATKIGAKKFEWITVGDERVRESHKEIDRQIFFYSRMPHQYNDYNCRCSQIPIFESVKNTEFVKIGGQIG